MKNILIALAIVIGCGILGASADVEETQYFKDGYRAQTEDGYHYTSSKQRLVYVCEGHYVISYKLRNNAACLSPFRQKYIDILFHPDSNSVYWQIIRELDRL